MSILSRLWPWMLILFCGTILASFVYAIILDQIFPWEDGQRELAKTENVSSKICLGGMSYHYVSAGGHFEESSSSFGISKDISPQSALIHLNEKDRHYKQRSYVLLASLFDHPGLWTVTQNQDGEFTVDFSPSSLLFCICINLLLLVLAGVGVFKVVHRRKHASFGGHFSSFPNSIWERNCLRNSIALLLNKIVR